MADSWPFEAVVREIVEQLAAGKYAELERRTGGVRLSAGELATAVATYRRRLVAPKDGAEMELDVVPIRGAEPKAWSVDVPLWTEEEGRSDLTLQLTIRPGRAGVFVVEIDDLHVL
jgi:hypothetical protein